MAIGTGAGGVSVDTGGFVGTNVGVLVGTGIPVGVAVGVSSGTGVLVGADAEGSVGIGVFVSACAGVFVDTGVLVGTSIGLSVGSGVLVGAVTIGSDVGSPGQPSETRVRNTRANARPASCVMRSLLRWTCFMVFICLLPACFNSYLSPHHDWLILPFQYWRRSRS